MGSLFKVRTDSSNEPGLMQLTMCISVVPSRLRFVEGGQIWGRPTRLAQNSRGILVLLGSFRGLSYGNRWDVPKPRGHCGFDREGPGGQVEDTARNNPSRRATGSITRWCVPPIWRVVFHALLSLDVVSSEERSGRDCWNFRRDAVGFQVPSEDSEEVAGIRGRENEPGLVASYAHRLSYCL